jgi:hypothetical protein
MRPRPWIAADLDVVAQPGETVLIGQRRELCERGAPGSPGRHGPAHGRRQGLAVRAGDLLSMGVAGRNPRFAVLAPGHVADDRIDPGDIAALDLRTVTVSP